MAKIGWIIGIVILILFFISYPLEEYSKESTTFTFSINETEESINGEIWIQNKMIGETSNGKIELSWFNTTPEEFVFKGVYNKTPFEFIYNFPEDYKLYDIIPFVILQEDLDYLNKINWGEDDYSHTNQTHWSHMPLTYNYNKNCSDFSKINGTGRFVVKIENGLKYIVNETNGAINFEYKNSSEVDIMFYCDFTKETETYFLYNPYVDFIQSDISAYAEPYYYEESNLFTSSEIHFVRTDSCPADKIPVVVIHEVGHLLGLEHNMNPARTFDIMNPFQQDCNKARFLKSDLEYLWEIYDPAHKHKPFFKYNCIEKGYYSCMDFDTQEDSQEVFKYCNERGKGDMHNLDPDEDGIACENLY